MVVTNNFPNQHVEVSTISKSNTYKYKQFSKLAMNIAVPRFQKVTNTNTNNFLSWPVKSNPKTMYDGEAINDNL